MSVSTGLVSNVKFIFGKKAARPSVRVAGRKTRGRNGPKAVALTVGQLIEVKRLANELGGPEQVRQALETLEQLR